MLSHTLLPKLKILRLSGVLDTLEERAQLARDQDLSPVEFFALLLDDDCEPALNTDPCSGVIGVQN